MRQDPVSAGLLIWAAVLHAFAVWDAFAHSPLTDQPISDARHYLSWADAIRAGQARDTVFFMAPVYAYFLAAVRSVFGNGLVGIALVQATLGWLALWGMGQLARTLGGRTGRRITLGLGVLYGAPLYFESKMLATTLALFLGTALLLTLLSAERRESWTRWALAGLLLGLLAGTRPQALLFAPLAAAWALLGSGRLSSRIRRAALLAAGTLIAIAPITLHNLAAGDFVLIASNGGVNLYFGNNPLAEGTFNAPSADFASIETQEHASQELARRALDVETLKPSQASAYWRGRATDFITDTPGDWLALEWKKLRAFVSSFEYGIIYSYDVERRLLVTPWLAPLPFGALLALALAGGLAIARNRDSRLLMAFCLAQLAVMLIFFVYGRFRIAMLPGLLPLAGGIVWLRCCPRVWQVVISLLALAVLIASFWVSDPHQARQVANAECEIGNAWLVEGEDDRAEESFQRALRAVPGFFKAHQGLGRVQAARGEWALALEAYDAAAEANEPNGWLWSLRGDALAGLERYRQAKDAYLEALRLDGDLGAAMTGLIEMVYEKTGQWEEAASYATQAARAKPQNLDFQVSAAYACARWGRTDLGRPFFETARRLAPPSDIRVANLARIY
ncbi:MAG: tetratricopeptide repeat protein [Planctomycetota bacterium]